MRRILALVSCKEAHDGPWYYPRGNEIAIMVSPMLKADEYVIVEVESDAGGMDIHVRSGTTHLPQLVLCKRYRVKKIGPGHTPTTAEIITHGPALRRAGKSHHIERANKE